MPENFTSVRSAKARRETLTQGNKHGILRTDSDFKYQQSLCYPLTYDGIPVFVGYAMDLFKIQFALEDHLDGKDFYVACFPEQAPLYRNLFPGKTVL
jgi:hypothetical protein